MKNTPESTHKNLRPGPLALVTCLVLSLLSQPAQPVTSKITRHRSKADMSKGQVKDVVVGSQGTLRLGRAWETPVEEFEDVWSINSIVVIGGTVYIGTSPNGGIFEYSLGKLTKIYPVESQEQQQQEAEAVNNDATNEPNDANTVKAKEYLANEHIFAMATDVAGRLLAGISGKKCELLRFEAGRIETIFEPTTPAISSQ